MCETIFIEVSNHIRTKASNDIHGSFERYSHDGVLRYSDNGSHNVHTMVHTTFTQSFKQRSHNRSNNVHTKAQTTLTIGYKSTDQLSKR